MKFIKHIVADMDESMIQRCLICGTEVSNYRGMMQEAGSPPPRGFAAGEVWVSNTRNPRITTIEETTDCETENCKP